MMKRIAFIFSLLLSCLCASQAQVQMLFSADSLAGITSPADLDSLFYWFAADVAVLDSAGNSISTGEGVGTWTDLSGNGYNVVQADTTKDPRWCATCGPNGKPAIVFNGTDEFLASTAHWWGSDDLTVFVVMKFANATRDASEVLCAVYTGGGGISWIFTSGSASLSYGIRFGWSDDGSNLAIPQFGAKSTSYRLINCIKESTDNGTSIGSTSNIDAYINSASQSQIAGGSARTGILDQSVTPFSIGAANITSTPSGFLQGSISEIIVTTDAVSATTRAAIENYLNKKYALY